VLCEKPIGLNAAEAEALLAARDRTGVVIGEAFIVRVHPQWAAVVDLVRAGRIGELRSIEGHFSYVSDDRANVRHVAAYGGGALLDVGCYLVNVARLVFGEEPSRVFGAMERDPGTGVDERTSFVLDFGDRVATGTCGMRSARHQRVEILGTRGRIEIEVPFGVPPDRQTHVTVDGGSDAIDPWRERLAFGPLNQYTLQGDLVSRAIREGGPVPCPLEDSVANMRVLDAIVRSAATGMWASIG
jgi:predicted dehydrogenase